MSKGADDETDMDAGMTTSERRRRRRRGAGLRIPSDNVPRRSGPVVAPVPEDPAVAMSIAYAFDDSSAPQRLATDEDEAAGEGLGDLEDSTAFSPPPVPPAAPEGSSTAIPSLDDVVPDGRTRQMAAVSLEALGLSDVEDAVAGNGTPSGDVDIDVDGLDDASDDAQSDDDEGDDFGENEAPIQRRPATIPPPIGVTDAAAKMAAAAKAAAAAAVTAKVAAAVAASGSDAVPEARMSRAATLALSEDDLEELLEATPPPQKAPLPPAATAAALPTSGIIPISPNAHVPPPSSAPAAAPAAPASASPASPAASAPPAVSDALSSAPTGPLASMSAAPVAANVGNTTGEAVALAEEDLQEVAGPADAGDSGEILADEIMEVEQDARAPVAIGPQGSGPVTLPSSPGSSGTHPLTPHAAPPPPPAASTHAKPPAAPPKKSLTARHAQAAAVAAPSAEADARRGKRRGKPWFEEIFDEDYLRTLPFLTPQATQAEALMVIESLGVQAGAAVLDVGCGYGRHAMELAARGFHVVGVDLSLPLLLRGADEAQRRGLDINFVHADMREMDFDAQFDGAYCLFSTFGFFDDETNKKTAALIARSLKPGAKFMLEILNRDYVIGDLPARVWWEGDGCVVLEEVEFNYFSSRVQSKRSVVFDDGRQVEQEISVRVYSLHEVGKLLHAAGLRVLEVSGSMASRGRFLGTRSREIIVVAERRPPDGKS